LVDKLFKARKHYTAKQIKTITLFGWQPQFDEIKHCTKEGVWECGRG